VQNDDFHRFSETTVKLLPPGGQSLRRICTKFDIGFSCAPKTALECSPDPLAELEGPNSKGREGTGEKGEV